MRLLSVLLCSPPSQQALHSHLPLLVWVTAATSPSSWKEDTAARGLPSPCQRITEAVGGSTDFLNATDYKQKFRELEHSQRKFVAYDLHLRTLSEYIKLNHIPRGLRVLLCPTLFASDKFCQRWEVIINKCSLGLMLLPDIKKHTEIQDSEMQNFFPSDIVAEGTEKLMDHIQRFQNEVEEKMRREKAQKERKDDRRLFPADRYSEHRSYLRDTSDLWRASTPPSHMMGVWRLSASS
ncbi:hypothetical protein XELAEV_18021102mg [Xenopus laevis]|uniref:Uncharacterized protein n=1 Tax=Xenopus laevis TaxID=8355 RepID=A0A974HR24_XENLA|nr:hypothetical protein XELAEV_18021102mg [Xenopus laevis]